MNRLILIPAANLPNVVSVVYPKIDAATAYSAGKYKGSDVLACIAKGQMQLWAAFDEESEKVKGVAITEIAVFPQARVLRFLCATGEDLGEWIGHIDAMERWGESMGCGSFQAECRPGWEKSLRERGYRRTHIVMNKDLGSCH